MLSYKYLKFEDWKKIFEMQKSRLHLNPLEQKKCLDIKYKINNKNLIYSFNHLESNLRKLLNF